jgi:tRNA A-37 threonylcarbamoyl transferase component Bud32
METRVSVADSRPSRSRTGFLSSLVPRFDEQVSPEFFRLSGKLRVISNALFLIANLIMAPQVTALGFDPHVHLRTAIAFIGIHAVDLTLGLILWRVKLRMHAMRQLTYASVTLETMAVVFAAWVYGSVNSPFIGVELVFITMYRLAFDFRVGLLAFLLIIVGQWVVVGAELAGVLPPQPMAPEIVDHVYTSPMRELGAMVYLSFAIALTFVVAHWAVGRMRHKDVAIRMLRESLYAAEQGKVGRHTGRTLRDTYALGPLLGAGGMGEVYTGSHLRTRRKVAVKMLHPHLVEDPTVIARFRREAEIIGKLGSEHIIEVIDIDDDEGQPFLVLELMEGENLASRIANKGPLTLDEIAELLSQLAEGLDIAHKAGVVHRDLKPENVFLCPRREGGFVVKILDFGVSKIGGNATAITQEVAILGTPDYMSPEQAAGHADDVDAASDVFSLAGVVYAALTGRRPFEGASVPALLRKICDEEPVPLAELRTDTPAGVVHVLAIAMAKRPRERYTSASDFARDFAAAVAGTVDPKLEVRASMVVRGRPARRKRPTINPAGHTHLA